MLVCWLWSSGSVTAQTACPSPCTVDVGQAFTVTASHGGQNTTGYRIYVDGVKVGSDLPFSQLSSGTVTVAALVAPARGTHTIQLAAFNADKETKSDPFTMISTLPAPPKPGPVQLLLAITVAENGDVTLKMLPAAK